MADIQVTIEDAQPISVSVENAQPINVSLGEAVNVYGGGVSVHGELTGLLSDDHPQYHTDTRGDARYYQKTEVDSALTLKADFPTVNSSIPARGGLGAQTSVPYTSAVAAHTIVQRGNMGVINTGTPTAATHAATKLYVDMIEDKMLEYGMGVIVHGTNPSAVRPTGFAQITWVGSIKPLNALENDVWVSEVSS